MTYLAQAQTNEPIHPMIVHPSKRLTINMGILFLCFTLYAFMVGIKYSINTGKDTTIFVMDCVDRFCIDAIETIAPIKTKLNTIIPSSFI